MPCTGKRTMPNRSPLLSRRRFFLQSAGVTLSLPFLQSLPTKLLAAGGALGANATDASRPMRMAAIGNLLGFYQPAFFPKKAGADYELTRLLKPLAPHRNDFTLFSGLDHDHKGGHFAVHSFLTGVLSADAKDRPEGNISIDQLAAESVGNATRFPTLTIGSESGQTFIANSTPSVSLRRCALGRAATTTMPSTVPY